MHAALPYPPVVVAAIEIRSARRRFGDVDVFADIDIDVAAGHCLAIVGPSGCGKTTLLRAMGGLESLDGGAISRANGGIAITFQEPRLLPWRTTLDNVGLPLELAGTPAGERRDRAEEALRRMRIADAARLMPNQLSGGMRMRAAMARALVTRPSILLLDEPFAALDEVTRCELDEELRVLLECEGMTAVLVTHSIHEAVFLADRIVVLSPRPARIVHGENVVLPERGAEVRTSDAFNAHVRSVSDHLYRSLRTTTRGDAA